MLLKTSVPEVQKRNRIETSVIAPGHLAREQLEKEKVSSTLGDEQQWTDQEWYQDQGFREDRYQHPTGRYYGDRRGPYPSRGTSSSSQAPRWEGWYGGLR